jgi:hypothetical protein
VELGPPAKSRGGKAVRRADIRRFQLHLAESGASICNRNLIMDERA